MRYLVAALAFLITRPAPLLRPPLGLARSLEEHDANKVITAMLGES